MILIQCCHHSHCCSSYFDRERCWCLIRCFCRIGDLLFRWIFASGMSSRGHSTCLKCKQEYFNCSKPPDCTSCALHLGSTFVQKKKKPKQSNPAVVEIIQSLYSCRSSDPGDRCFVTCSGDSWLCSLEKCKVARSVHVNSGLVDSFECQHIKEAKNSSDCSPIATLYPDLVNYPCSDVVCSELSQIVSSLPSANSPSVIQVSDRSFAVFGSPSASNPLGLCHVQKEARTKSGYTCTGKDCRSYASKAKGIAVKACCLHLHLPFASLRQFPSLDSCTSSESISVLVIAGPSQTPWHTSSSSIAAAEPSCSSSRPTASASSSSSTATIHTPTTSASSCSATMHTNPVSSSIQRQSTVTLAEKCRKLIKENVMVIRIMLQIYD